jgi:hypothetical protein
MQANWLRVVLVGAILLIASSVWGEDFQITGVARVIDGDTIEIRGVRIRLFGIDAPEGAQDCGRADGTRWDCAQQATSALENYLQDRTVVCVRRDVDRYGRLVCQCTVSGTNGRSPIPGIPATTSKRKRKPAPRVAESGREIS